jgi:hypothetical protein
LAILSQFLAALCVVIHTQRGKLFEPPAREFGFGGLRVPGNPGHRIGALALVGTKPSRRIDEAILEQSRGIGRIL